MIFTKLVNEDDDVDNNDGDVIDDDDCKLKWNTSKVSVIFCSWH